MPRLRPYLWMVCLLGASCYNDIESKLYPETGCTPVTTVSYAQDIAPLMKTYCTSCHAGTFASGGIPLDSYTAVKRYADSGQLLGSVQWSSGFSPMPKNSSKLPACKIGLIQQWITAGALNN